MTQPTEESFVAELHHGVEQIVRRQERRLVKVELERASKSPYGRREWLQAVSREPGSEDAAECVVIGIFVGPLAAMHDRVGIAIARECVHDVGAREERRRHFRDDIVCDERDVEQRQAECGEKPDPPRQPRKGEDEQRSRRRDRKTGEPVNTCKRGQADLARRLPPERNERRGEVRRQRPDGRNRAQRDNAAGADQHHTSRPAVAGEKPVGDRCSEKRQRDDAERRELFRIADAARDAR